MTVGRFEFDARLSCVLRGARSGRSATPRAALNDWFALASGGGKPSWWRPLAGPCGQGFAETHWRRVSYPPTLVPPAGVVEPVFGIVGVQARVRVMGVDPALTRCGLSVVESGRGRQIVALDVDVVRTPADESLPKGLMAINDAVEYWLDVHRPQ